MKNERQPPGSAVAPSLRTATLMALVLSSAVLLHGQGAAPFQDDFPADEFVARRNQVFDAIGLQAVALIQGAPGIDGFKVFRQSNEFTWCDAGRGAGPRAPRHGASRFARAWSARSTR